MFQGKNRKIFFIAMLTMALLLVAVTIVLADDVVNYLDTSPDPNLEEVTISPGGSTTISFYIHATTGGGDANGCNATGSSPAYLTITPPEGVTVNWDGYPNPLKFVGCDDPTHPGNITFSSDTPGNYNINSFSMTDGKTGSIWNYSTAFFTLKVQAADSTAPTLHLPANMTVEATSSSGAAVNFSVTADDANPAHPTVTCNPASGSTFALGTTTVNCSASDAAGNEANDNFTITVQDTTAPVLSMPDDQTFEGNTTGGYSGSYTGATATDVVDASPTVVCTPASPHFFALGDNTVNCTATDASGNFSTNSFKITVVDTTAPVLSMPDDQTFEGNTTGGYSGSYTGATATDVVDASPTVVCTPASPHFFALGDNTVNCTATDASGNFSTNSFKITVVDTTAPALSVPDNMNVQATSIAGAVVTFSATATDIVDPSPVVVCTPPSGSLFPPGETTVSCTATDSSSNEVTKSFKITVSFTRYGFYQPVDMNGVYNKVKGGSTVPLKFEVFAGSNEITSTSVVKSYGTKTVSCEAGVPIDDIETLATGGTSLRYDSTSGQFIFNWQTPKTPGACIRFTLTLIDDSEFVAYFILK
jgi:hypothetical protein